MDEIDIVSPPLPPFHEPDGSWAQSVGLVGLGIWGPAPGVLPGAAAYFSSKWQRDSVWAPSARVSILHAQRGGFESRYGTAKFALTGGSLELCPLAFVAGRLELRPCAMATAGALLAKGSDTAARQEHFRPWVVLGSSAFFMIYPAELLEVSLQAGLGAPLLRDQFQFRPDVIHEVPELVASTSFGLGLRFP